MSLPNAERAVIDPTKVRDYLLDGIPAGPSGRSAAVKTVWIIRVRRAISALYHRFSEVIMFKLLDTVVLKRDVPEAGMIEI